MTMPLQCFWPQDQACPNRAKDGTCQFREMERCPHFLEWKAYNRGYDAALKDHIELTISTIEAIKEKEQDESRKMMLDQAIGIIESNSRR
jgi:hypothetical protein